MYQGSHEAFKSNRRSQRSDIPRIGQPQKVNYSLQCEREENVAPAHIRRTPGVGQKLKSRVSNLNKPNDVSMGMFTRNRNPSDREGTMIVVFMVWAGALSVLKGRQIE